MTTRIWLGPDKRRQSLVRVPLTDKLREVIQLITQYGAQKSFRNSNVSPEEDDQEPDVDPIGEGDGDDNVDVFEDADSEIITDDLQGCFADPDDPEGCSADPQADLEGCIANLGNDGLGARCFFWSECRSKADEGWEYCQRCYATRRNPCSTAHCRGTCTLQAHGGEFHSRCVRCRTLVRS